jgi:hypothetical protein
MKLSRFARYQIMTAYDEAEIDGGNEDRGRLMRVYRWAATENWDEQRTELNATHSNEVNEDETMKDEDASSIDTMNGWNALDRFPRGSALLWRTLEEWIVDHYATQYNQRLDEWMNAHTRQ